MISELKFFRFMQVSFLILSLFQFIMSFLFLTEGFLIVSLCFFATGLYCIYIIRASVKQLKNDTHLQAEIAKEAENTY